MFPYMLQILVSIPDVILKPSILLPSQKNHPEAYRLTQQMKFLDHILFFQLGLTKKITTAPLSSSINYIKGFEIVRYGCHAKI